MQKSVLRGYSLSPQQRRLWFLQQDAGGQAFRAQCAVLIRGALDEGMLRTVVEHVINRNQILRTTFRQSVGLAAPLQVVADAPHNLCEEHCYSSVRGLPKPDCINELLNEAGQLSLDCVRGPVVHWLLDRLSVDTYALVIALPSLCSDSCGLTNIVREISQVYATLVGLGELAESPLQYIIAAEWQNDLFETEDFEIGRRFWNEHELSRLEGLRLPHRRQSKAELSFDPRSLAFTIGSDECVSVDATARRFGIPSSSLLLGCWFILLGKLTGQLEITVGAGCDGRSDEELERSVGLFAKYLPLRLRLDDRLGLGDFLRQVHRFARAAEEWQEWFDWEHLKGASEGSARKVFFPLCFDFEDWPADISAAGLTFSIEYYYACIDRFELKLRCIRTTEAVVVELYYNSAVFTEAEVDLISRQYRKVMDSALDHPDACIGDLEVLTEQEKDQILSGFVSSSSEYARDGSIPQLFERQAEQTPDRLAAVYEDHSLTYAELDRRTNQVANWLIGKGVKVETLVPICVEQSLEMIVGIFGILKAGAAYVPLDPRNPRERLSLVVTDSRAALLLTQRSIADNLGALEVNKVWLDEDWPTIRRESDTSCRAGLASGNLAYVIYTSGSTGKPKGVMVQHESMKNLLAALDQSTYADLPQSPLAISLNAPMAFDASVQQLLTLARGDTLHIIPREVRMDARSLISYFATWDLDVFDCTPSHLQVLLKAGLLDCRPQPLKAVLVAGEAIGGTLWQDLARADRPIFYNIYGPTECTVDATFCRVRQSPDKPTIGRPLPDYQVYVLDSNSRLAPIGATGGINIAGVGLARGYLNQPRLTADKFPPNPFSEQPGARLYNTGDLGAYSMDGTIEFLGRLDEQVKIRGYRIELGEIESVLAGHNDVRDSAVCMREDDLGEKRVVAYIMPADGRNPAREDLRAYLQARLPQYMIPSAFVFLSGFPVTSSGKLDRKALPVPKGIADRHTVPPRDSTELQLFHIWSEVLRTDEFGIKDNFFDLGGHSLTAVSLSTRISRIYGEKVSITTVFDYPTVERMAGYLREEVACVPPSALVPIEPRGTRPPFFCVHPASGLAHIFIPLARSLGPDQPFYGLQSFEVDLERVPTYTVEDMAAQYLADLKRLRPVGPYQIGGYSSGGVVAYEMAQQLYAGGEDVSLLVMLDASVPSSQVEDRPLTQEELDFQLHDEISRFSERRFRLPASEVRAMTIQEMVQLNLKRERELIREGGISGMTVDVTEVQAVQFFRNRVTNWHASRRYRPKPYPGRLTLLRGNNDREHDYGWSRWVLGGVDVYRFDADHGRILQYPAVSDLGAQLTACLADCSRQSSKRPELQMTHA